MTEEIRTTYEKACAELEAADAKYQAAYTAWENAWADIKADELGARQALRYEQARYDIAMIAHRNAEFAFDSADTL